jgi:uncharacterized protein (TIRG00374 family)
VKGTALRVLVPLAISAVLLVLVVNSVRGEADQLTAALATADWRLIFPAVGLYFIGTWLRSVRWGLLLPDYAIRTRTLFAALVVGFTVNNLLPLRMGEVARTYLLGRWCRVPYSATVASLVVERVMDGLSLSLLLLIALRLVPAPTYLFAVGIIAACGFLGGLVLLGLAAWRGSALVAITDLLMHWFPARVRVAATSAAATFARSLALVHDPLLLARVLALSLLVWCFELGLFFVLMFSLSIPGSYPQALLVGSSANFATLLPSSPGYAGTFDAALTRVAQDTLGISAGLAGAYDIIVRAALFLPVVAVGTLVLWRTNVTFGQIAQAPRSAADSGLAALTSTKV